MEWKPSVYQTQGAAIAHVFQGRVSSTALLALSVAMLGLFGTPATKYLCVAGMVVLALHVCWSTFSASVGRCRVRRFGWRWMTVSVAGLIGLGLTYAIREVWWQGVPPWILFDALFAVTLGACALALVHIAAHSVRQAYRRFLDASALGCAATMTIWSTPYGEAILRHSTPESMVKALQMTMFCVVFFTAVAILVRGPKQGPAWLLAVSWVLSFTLLIVIAVLASFRINVNAGLLGLPLTLSLIGTQAAALHRWPRPATSFGKPASALVANIAVCCAVALLAVQSLGNASYTLIAIWQIAVVSVVVAARNTLALWEIGDLVAKLGSRKRQLLYDATHDALTGLVNRREFTRLVNVELSDAKDEPVSVAFLDLDGFKLINDTYGHQCGDEVLVQVAEHLQEAMPEEAVCGRLSGDEFAVMIRSADEDVAESMTAFASTVRSLRASSGVEVRLTASVGVATATSDEAVTAGELIHRADLAMYVIKHDGRDGCAVHSSQISSPFLDDRLLAPALQKAVEVGQIETHYQPVFDFRTQRITGFEALSRWHHEGVNVNPERFIRLAERGGLINDLTFLVAERACSHIRLWRETAPETYLGVSINVPAPSLTSPHLIPTLINLADEYGVPKAALTVEVTESMPIRDIAQTCHVLNQARDHGIGVALDDFGTGCNSIAHLLQLPLTKVKIDPTMVRGIEVDPSRADIVAGMIALATQRCLEVVAEGVENVQQLNILRQMGVHSVQGYLLGMPHPAEHWLPLVADSETLHLDELTLEETVMYSRTDPTWRRHVS